MPLDDRKSPCHDCNAKPGEFHQPGCDVERCPFCGGQLISCGCCYRQFYPSYGRAFDEFNGLPAKVYYEGLQEAQATEWDRVLKTKGLLPWTGIWPGVEECREFGWYSRWVEGSGWVRCDKDHPGAGADLNRLHSEARWDAEARRFVLAAVSHR